MKWYKFSFDKKNIDQSLYKRSLSYLQLKHEYNVTKDEYIDIFQFNNDIILLVRSI
jgi:hypothetical protein